MSKKEAVSKGRQCDEHRNKEIDDNLEKQKFSDQEECSNLNYSLVNYYKYKVITISRK